MSVQMNAVSKSFGPVDVIKGVDLSIDEGEFAVFVGPSGCGKSTLLRLVAGLEESTSGQIHIGSNDVTHVEASERGVAMVFQSYALYPHMDVADNMGFGLKMTGRPKEEIEKRVERAAEILHLGPLLKRKPKQLSGGQRQRVAIGRAIVRQPKVFLFDEPLSNLDAELRVQMRLEIAKLHQELGATMIYVTHDQVEAMTLADKIVVLRDGYVEQVGAPIELYSNPDNVFVAGFIGSPKMNFLNAVAGEKDGNGLQVTIEGFGGARFSKQVAADNIQPGHALLVGIRPEHFLEKADVMINVDIDVIENLGGTAFAYARADDSEGLTIELAENAPCEEGKSYNTGFDPDRCFLFDRNSTQRIR